MVIAGHNGATLDASSTIPKFRWLRPVDVRRHDDGSANRVQACNCNLASIILVPRHSNELANHSILRPWVGSFQSQSQGWVEPVNPQAAGSLRRSNTVVRADPRSKIGGRKVISFPTTRRSQIQRLRFPTRTSLQIAVRVWLCPWAGDVWVYDPGIIKSRISQQRRSVARYVQPASSANVNLSSVAGW